MFNRISRGISAKPATKTLKTSAILAAFLGSIPCAAIVAQGATVVLGTAANFAVLGHTGVTNTGPTVVTGNVGDSEVGANAISGFSTAGNTFNGPGTFTNGPGLVTAPSQIYGGDAVAQQARNDLSTAFTALSNYGTATSLTGQTLGNGVGGTISTLVPGVYSFLTSAQLNGTLILDAQGHNNAVWIFDIGTTLTTASASAISFIDAGSNNGSDVGLYWVVGSSATLGTGTAFEGNILAKTSITLNTSASIANGRALALNGEVTLDSNVISNICPPPNNGPGFSGGLGFNDNGVLVALQAAPPTAVPLPSGFLLGGCGLLGLLGFRLHKKSHVVTD